MRKTVCYKTKRIIDVDRVYDVLTKTAFYNDGYITKAYVKDGNIFLYTDNRLIVLELENNFPNIFQLSNTSVPTDSEEFFSN